MKWDKLDIKKIIIICGVVIAVFTVVAYVVSLNNGNDTQNQIQNNYTSENVNNYNQYIGNQTNEITDSTTKVEYQEKTVRRVSNEKGTFTCKEKVPVISGMNENAASKIQNYIKTIYKKTWEDIDSQTDDDYVKRILNMKKSTEGETIEIGFTITAKMVYKTNKVISFEIYFTGGLGGVSWDKTDGVSFDVSTGDVIQISSIITSTDDYIEACKRYIFPLLRSDKRAKYFNNGYENAVNTVINRKTGYLTKNGICCVRISGDKISDVLSDEFEFTVPYENIKDYIKSEYVPSV